MCEGNIKMNIQNTGCDSVDRITMVQDRQWWVFVNTSNELICIKGILTVKPTPWTSALLERMPEVQLLKNFPTFYGTRRLIRAFTRTLNRSLS